MKDKVIFKVLSISIVLIGTLIAAVFTLLVTFQTKTDARASYVEIKTTVQYEMDYKFDTIQKSLDRIEIRLDTKGR